MSSAPSMRTFPMDGDQTPTRARARLDFPAALGPAKHQELLLAAAQTRFRAEPVLCYPVARPLYFPTDKLPSGGGRGIFSHFFWKNAEQPHYSVISASRRDESLPIRHCNFHRCERAPHDDRRCDHGAGRQFLFDRKISPCPQDWRPVGMLE